jgi:type I restriction enzyme S subunit
MSGKYQAYPDYKDSGDEWLDSIPNNWDISRIKYVASIFGRIGFRGYTVNDIVDEGEGAIVLSPSNIDDDKFSLNKKTYLSWDKYYESPEIIVDIGDILLVKTGSTYGKSTIVKKVDEPMTINPQMALLKKIQIDPRFLAYLLNSRLIKSKIDVNNTGSGMPTMTQENINSFPVPHPGNKLSTHIANFLDHETAKIDTLIEKQQQLINLLKEKRQAVISHAVTKGLNPNAPMRDSGVEWLGEVPEHWCGLPLKLLVRTRKGVAFKSDDFCDNGIRVVKASDIKQLSIRTSDVFLPEKFVGAYPKAVLASGDIILSTVGSNPDVINSAVGQIGMVPQELAGTLLNQNTVVYDPDEKNVIREYLFFVLQMRGYRDYLDLHAHGTANQSSLSIEDMLSFQVSLPPINEQVEICNYLNTQQEKLTALEQRAYESELLLKERRTALISAAVTGKINVRNWQAPVSFHNNQAINREDAA